MGCDVFMRALPMGFDPGFDARVLRRSRLVFASQITALLPSMGAHAAPAIPASGCGTAAASALPL